MVDHLEEQMMEEGKAGVRQVEVQGMEVHQAGRHQVEALGTLVAA